MNTTRAQHYIPRLILKNFTTSGSAEEHLWVTAPAERKQWKSLLGEAGHRCDFYRISHEGLDANFVEGFLANLENEIAPMVREMIGSTWLPRAKGERELLLQFLALWFARVPSQREMLERSFEAVTKESVRLLVTSRERWDQFVAARRADGVDFSDKETDYDRMKEFVDRDEYNVTLEGKDFQVKMMLRGAQFVLPLLRNRRWSLLVSRSGEFICADRPTLFFESARTSDQVPGLASKDTSILFPLSRHVLLLGSNESLIEVRYLNRKTVADLNRLALINTHRHVFSARSEFPWTDRGGKVRYDMPPMAKDDRPYVIDAFVKGSPHPERLVEMRERPLRLEA